MSAQDDDHSLWKSSYYRDHLLSYIGGIYGIRKDDIRKVINPLQIVSNGSDELDQLYEVIKQFEKQRGSSINR